MSPTTCRSARILPWAITAVAVFLILLMDAVPPVSRDALNHHLLVPKRYLSAGAIQEIPEIPFSYYPQNLEMLYLGALWLGSDILPKYIHFAFALLTALSMHRYLSRRFDEVWAAVGVCLFLTLPVILKLSVTVYVDLGLIFFSWTALVYFLYWQERGWRWREFLISAVCCGLALGVKYNGLVTLFILAAGVPAAYARHHVGKPRLTLSASGLAVLYVLIASVVFAPWWVRNLAWTGNPLYPLYGSLFKLLASGGDSVFNGVDTVNVYGSRLSHFAYRAIAFGESWWEIALVPLRIFFQGVDDNPRFFDGVLHPFLLVLPVIAIIGIRRSSPPWRREAGFLTLFAALTILMAFIQTDMRIRYMAPAIPALVILSVGGLRGLVNGLQRWRPAAGWQAAVLPVLLVVLMIPNALYAHRLFSAVDPIPFMMGKIDRPAYIAARRPEFVLFDHANRTLDPRSRLLSLFLGGRHYYCDLPIVESPGIFLAAIRQAGSAQELAERLQDAGFTHMVFYVSLLDRWLQDNLEADRLKVAADFFRGRTVLVMENRGYVMVALRGEGARCESWR